MRGHLRWHHNSLITFNLEMKELDSSGAGIFLTWASQQLVKRHIIESETASLTFLTENFFGSCSSLLFQKIDVALKDKNEKVRESP